MNIKNKLKQIGLTVICAGIGFFGGTKYNEVKEESHIDYSRRLTQHYEEQIEINSQYATDKYRKEIEDLEEFHKRELRTKDLVFRIYQSRHKKEIEDLEKNYQRGKK